jgi:ubiquinone biosynthesis protein UbiJ
MLLKALIPSSLETSINTYLNLADNRELYLEPLAGKVIAVTITPFAMTVYLCPNLDSIQVLNDYPYAVDTHLTGSLLALGFMGMRSKPLRSLFSGEVRIEGDIDTARKLQRLFEKLDINFESRLAGFIGKDIAQGLSQLVLATKDWSTESLETLKLNTLEFLQEESSDLPALPEATLFFDKVDELRNDYDRLQCRIERLEVYLNDKTVNTPQKDNS